METRRCRLDAGSPFVVSGVSEVFVRRREQVVRYQRRWLIIQWDQGKEIAGHKTLREKAGIEVYLCDPYSPWQRGTNENTNGLLRQYFPKSTNFYKLDQRAYDQVAAELNNRPRQILGWQTPHQALTAVTKQTS